MINRKAALSGIVVTAVAFVGACSDVPPTEPLALDQDVSLFGGAVQNPQSYDGTLDAHFVRIAQQNPGFGGFFYGEDGALNIYMTGAQPLSAGLGSSLAALGVNPAAQPVNVLAGQYDFADLASMRSRANSVLGLAGVVSTDVDEAANRVAIGVENAAAAAAVERALAMARVPREAVIIREVEPIATLQTLRDRVRPVAGGLQINFPGFLCTLGFNVRSPDAPGVHGFVTNSHCTNVRGEVTNTPYWQPSGSVPSPADPNFIGTEAHDIPFFTGGLCPAGRVCRWSDSAGARYAPGVDNAFARIYRTTAPNTGSLTIDGMFNIVAERAFPNVGDVMHKVGRTTGWTNGTVSQSCVDTNVSGTNITMLCQEWVTGASNIVAGGDSGSGVFDMAPGGGPNDVRLTGLLWGGGTGVFVFSAMSEVRFENPPPPGISSWRTFPPPPAP